MTTKDNVIKEYFGETEVNKEMNILYMAAMVIRKEIDNTKDWQFTGTFNDVQTPNKLH